MMRPKREKAGPGQESVWDYPRPPALERSGSDVRVVFGGEVIAETGRAMLVKETSHPPVYFIPPEDVRGDVLREVGGGSFCEWKGGAAYFDVLVGERRAERACFCYPSPVARFAEIAGWYAFYAGAMDEVTVDGERVTAQPGGFYAGWITSKVVGPFKGGPGTMGW